MEQMYFLGDHTYLKDEDLVRHTVALGSSGSGKTVLCKSIIEEVISNRKKVIAIDPQGDICSLIFALSKEEAQSQGIDFEKVKKFKENANIKIYTPGSKVGKEISLNPFPIKINQNLYESIALIDQVSKFCASVLGYKNHQHKLVQKFLYKVLEYSATSEIEIKNFEELRWVIQENFHSFGELSLLTEKEIEKLITNINLITIGLDSVIFNQRGFSIEELNQDQGSLSIIYLNTLNTQEEKDQFISIFFNKIYSWMLRNPRSNFNSLVYFDEIAPFVPAGNKSSFSKEILRLFFKQARKYGVGCLISTQNPSDIDYRSLGQFNTWFLGKLITSQDISKIKFLIEKEENHKEILSNFPKMNAGEFYVIKNNSQEVNKFKVRNLYTKHCTLNPEDIEKEKKTTVEVETDECIYEIEVDSEGLSNLESDFQKNGHHVLSIKVLD